MSAERFERYRQAYLEMAKVKYRPAAPSDGFGNIQLTREQLRDPARLEEEAQQYAARFVRQDDAMEYHIGCPNFRANRAFCYTIEAATLMCGGWEANLFAKKLLKLAADELQKAKRDRSRA